MDFPYLMGYYVPESIIFMRMITLIISIFASWLHWGEERNSFSLWLNFLRMMRTNFFQFVSIHRHLHFLFFSFAGYIDISVQDQYIWPCLNGCLNHSSFFVNKISFKGLCMNCNLMVLCDNLFQNELILWIGTTQLLFLSVRLSYPVWPLPNVMDSPWLLHFYWRLT